MISSLGLSNYKNINALLRKDNLDREIFIFDDMRDLSLPDEPVKLEMIIFAVCISGKGHVKINLKEYDVTPNSLVALLPNHIIQGYSISKDFKAIFLGITSEYAHEIIPDIHTLTPVVVSFKESPITLLAPGEVERLWPEIVAIIRSVPSYEQCLDAMERAGCKTTIRQIGKDREFVARSFRYHPYMRRRLSLRRVANMLEFVPHELPEC